MMDAPLCFVDESYGAGQHLEGAADTLDETLFSDWYARSNFLPTFLSRRLMRLSG